MTKINETMWDVWINDLVPYLSMTQFDCPFCSGKGEITFCIVSYSGNIIKESQTETCRYCGGRKILLNHLRLQHEIKKVIENIEQHKESFPDPKNCSCIFMPATSDIMTILKNDDGYLIMPAL